MPEPIDPFEEVPGRDESESETHLSDHWAVVVKYRRLVIACIVAALVAAAVLTYLATPMYRANTVLDIVRQSSDRVGLAGSVPIVGSEDFLPSQVELLQSRDVAERVVRQLNLMSDPEFLALYPHLQPDPPLTSSADKKKAPRQPSAREISRAAGVIRGDADASIVKSTSLVRVSYESPSPRLAAEVANAIADAYIEWNIESRFRQIAQSAQFLATQIEEAKRDIDEKERALLVYARKQDILTVDTPVNSSGGGLGGFSDDYAVAVADRVAKEARYQELQRTSAETVAESAAGGVFAQLKSDQSRLERDYADKLALYKPEWPAVQQLKKQVEDGNVRIAAAIRDTANKVREAARSDYLTALRRETSMKSMMRLKQSEALNQTANSSEYNNLRVEIDSKRALLNTLLREQGEAEVLSRLREEQVTNIRIVDRALRPSQPVSPSAPKNLAMALVLGCGLGLGVAFLLSYLDRTLQSGEQVERYVQLPALGAIPLVGNARQRRGARKNLEAETLSGDAAGTAGVELMPHQNPRSALSEAYRAFRTALLFSRAGGVKLVAITSVLPQEGKTATAVNLAVVLAQLGRRVLVVDADLHRARVHEAFGVSNQAGLVSILAEGMEPSRVIVKTKIPGVFVVPAGPETPNPSGLLSSEDMRQFLELAAANFDHVVIDTPPVLATSDVLVFGQHTDGVVLCIRAGVTPRDQVRRVRDKLLRGGIPILGVLLNGRKPDSAYYEYRYLNYGERSPATKESESKEPLGRTEQEGLPGRGVISGA